MKTHLVAQLNVALTKCYFLDNKTFGLKCHSINIIQEIGLLQFALSFYVQIKLKYERECVLSKYAHNVSQGARCS